MAGQGPPVDDSASVITDEDFSSGGTAVRIASVAALGGLLFGYDSAVINGAVKSIEEQFKIGIDRTGVRRGVGAPRCRGRRDDGGPHRRQDRPHLGDEDRRGAVLHQRHRDGVRARGHHPGGLPRHRRHRRRRRLGDRARLHRRDVAAPHPRQVGFAAAVGHRVGHLPVLRDQHAAADDRGRCRTRTCGSASTRGGGCSW